MTEKNQSIVIIAIDKEWCKDCLLPKGMGTNNNNICACIISGWFPEPDEKSKIFQKGEIPCE